MEQDREKSKPKRDPYKVALFGDGLFDRSSRLAVYFTEVGLYVYAHRDTMIAEIKCNEQQLKHSLWVLTDVWKLWEWHEKQRRYCRLYQDGEVDQEGREVRAPGFFIPKFKLRVQRTINGRVALRWLLTDLTRKGPTQRMHADFAKQLEMNKVTISRYMNGYTLANGKKVSGLKRIMDLSYERDPILDRHLYERRSKVGVLPPEPDRQDEIEKNEAYYALSPDVRTRPVRLKKKPIHKPTHKLKTDDVA